MPTVLKSSTIALCHRTTTVTTDEPLYGELFLQFVLCPLVSEEFEDDASEDGSHGAGEQDTDDTNSNDDW